VLALALIGVAASVVGGNISRIDPDRLVVVGERTAVVGLAEPGVAAVDEGIGIARVSCKETTAGGDGSPLPVLHVSASSARAGDSAAPAVSNAAAARIAMKYITSAPAIAS
jgi:hypothetical protein